MNEPKLPEGWRVVRLGELSKISAGGTPSRNHPEFYGGQINWVKTLDLNEGFVMGTEEQITEAGLRNIRGKLRPLNTVMVAMYGGAGTVGKSGILAIPAVTNQAVCCIEPNPKKFDSLYLLYHLICIRSGWMRQAIGTRKDPNISKGIIEKTQIPLPPLTEQQAIAETLRAVQQAREARRRELALERERKASLMQYLFTHGPQAESVSTQKTRFGEVPKHWKILPLYECSFVQTGVTKGRNFGSNPTITLPYLRVANVQDGFLDLSEIKEIRILKSEIDRFRLQVGDVVLTEGGDFDKLGRGFIWHGEIPDCVHQNHVFAVRVNRDLLQPEYFAYFVQSNYGKAYFLSVAHRTTNLASINSTKLKDLPTLIPPLSEQSDIAKTLHACDAKIAALERESALLEELFRALLEELMTGRIRVKVEG